MIGIAVAILFVGGVVASTGWGIVVCLEKIEKAIRAVDFTQNVHKHADSEAPRRWR